MIRVLELDDLRQNLIDDECEAETEHGRVRPLINWLLLKLVVKHEHKEIDHEEAIDHKRHELRLENLLTVPLPVAAKQTADELGPQDGLVFCIVQYLDQAQEVSIAGM